MYQRLIAAPFHRRDENKQVSLSSSQSVTFPEYTSPSQLVGPSTVAALGVSPSLYLLDTPVDVADAVGTALAVLRDSPEGRHLLPFPEEEVSSEGGHKANDQQDDNQEQYDIEEERSQSMNRVKLSDADIELLSETAARRLWLQRAFLERCFGLRFRRRVHRLVKSFKKQKSTKTQKPEEYDNTNPETVRPKKRTMDTLSSSSQNISSADFSNEKDSEQDRNSDNEEGDASLNAENGLDNEADQSPQFTSVTHYYLLTLPSFVPGFSPDINLLPLILLRLATEVEWPDASQSEGNSDSSQDQSHSAAFPDDEDDENINDIEEGKDTEEHAPPPGSSSDSASSDAVDIVALRTAIQTAACHLAGLFFVAGDSRKLLQIHAQTNISESNFSGSSSDSAQKSRVSPAEINAAQRAALVPTDAARRQLKEHFFPALFHHFYPPISAETDGSVVKVANLETFYKVFERC